MQFDANAKQQPSLHIDLGKLDARRRKAGVQVGSSRPVPVARTIKKFAERDQQQSGQRFLDSSAPRLIRHVAFCETAAGDVASPTAGKDEKLSQEFEDGVLIGGEAAVPLDIDDAGIRLLADFFLLLDEWDRELRVPSGGFNTGGGQQ